MDGARVPEDETPFGCADLVPAAPLVVDEPVDHLRVREREPVLRRPPLGRHQVRKLCKQLVVVLRGPLEDHQPAVVRSVGGKVGDPLDTVEVLQRRRLVVVGPGHRVNIRKTKNLISR